MIRKSKALLIIKKADNNYEFLGILNNPEEIDKDGRKVTYTNFSVYLPYTNTDEALIKSWDDNIPNYKVEPDSGGWLSILLNALPWILIFVFWIVILEGCREMQAEEKEYSHSENPRLKC